MVDITAAKLFWDVWCLKMADRVKEYAFTDDTKETVDVINLLLLGWVLLGLVVYILGNIIATQIRKRRAKKIVETSESPADSESALKQTTEVVSTAVPNLPQSQDSVTYKFVDVPVCSGEESDIVQWLNNVFSWIYNQRVVSPVFESWLSSLNTRTRILSTEHGVLVDFQNVVHAGQPPVLTDVFESMGPKDIVNISCHAEVMKVVFKVVVTQVKETNKNVYTYLLHLDHIVGQLSIDCLPEESAFFARFIESPVVELEVQPEALANVPAEESDALQNLICEIASEALSSSTIDLHLAVFTDCPKYSEFEYAVADGGKVPEIDQEERLLVKVVKADNLQGNYETSKPYCVVEMDEPPQHFETSIAEDSSHPVWDASFVFTCKSLSAELLFEVYDKSKPSNENFLGLCILSVEELMRNPAHQQVFVLQPRPLENDNVTGTITAEFSFLDYIEAPTEESRHNISSSVTTEVDVQPGKTIQTNSRVTAGGTIITTTTIKRTNEGSSNSENVTTSKELAETVIQPKLAYNISQSRQKFLNELIHESSNEHLLFNHDEQRQGKHDEVMPYNNDILLENGIKDETTDEVFKVLPEKNGHCNGTVKDTDLHVVLSNGIVETRQMCKLDSKVLHENGGMTFSQVHEISNGCIISETELPRIVEENFETCSTTSTIVNDNMENDVEDLPNTALKELEKQVKPIAPDKSTLIIHSVQRVKKDRSGKWQEIAETDTSGTDSLEASPASHPSQDSNQLSLPPSPSIHRNGVDRSRPKDKKSLLGNIRKKFSFRKMRSKSMDLRPDSSESPVPSEGNNRSISTERAKSSLAIRDTTSIKSARRYLAVPGSTRSSFSEASGVSLASSRTYINENSTLVIEINENGIIKRYLIPNSMIHRSKWKKKGIKLHLYNDHVFVAKHLAGSSLCEVCKKHLTRRPGKQGYQCRDCNLQCHKSCHVKVAEFCPNSSVTSMEVEYVHDPKVTKPKSA